MVLMTLMACVLVTGRRIEKVGASQKGYLSDQVKDGKTAVSLNWGDLKGSTTQKGRYLVERKDVWTRMG